MSIRRVSLALLLALGAACVALAVVLTGSWLAARAQSRPPAVVTRVDQLGDRVAVVQVEGAGAAAAADSARTSTLRWTLGALGLALVPVAGLAWLLSGRLAPRVGAPEEPEVDAGPDLLDQRERDRRHLQDIVHELRTPLAVAATNLDLATTTPGLDQDLGVHLAAARRGVERLARTVDDLAAHGRLLAVADEGTVDLAHELRALAAEQGGMAGERRLTIDVDAPERIVVPGDRSAVHTAVGNLLVNAVRLAPAGSVIRLASGEWEDWAWVAVRDEGPGLPDQDHERVFRRYWRGRYDLDRATGAGEERGIGLTIARQVTEAQGGHVTVRS
ncbi:MAG TPA: HAMP domain-containing sensor histidine kinase, partial [Acidimicrobiales bacterium]